MCARTHCGFTLTQQICASGNDRVWVESRRRTTSRTLLHTASHCLAHRDLKSFLPLFSFFFILSTRQICPWTGSKLKHFEEKIICFASRGCIRFTASPSSGQISFHVARVLIFTLGTNSSESAEHAALHTVDQDLWALKSGSRPHKCKHKTSAALFYMTSRPSSVIWTGNSTLTCFENYSQLRFLWNPD